jgi:hypothetical protein
MSCYCRVWQMFVCGLCANYANSNSDKQILTATSKFKQIENKLNRCISTLYKRSQIQAKPTYNSTNQRVASSNLAECINIINKLEKSQDFSFLIPTKKCDFLIDFSIIRGSLLLFQFLQ